jgi:hypothetical protein
MNNIVSSDKDIDDVYDWVDERLLAGEFDTVNNWLKEIVCEKNSVTFLLAALTTTLPAKSKLEYRPAFYNAVKSDIERRGEMQEALLIGLE